MSVDQSRKPDHVFVAPSPLRGEVKDVLLLCLVGLAGALWRLWDAQPGRLGASAGGLASGSR